jgi:hypothetical protein
MVYMGRKHQVFQQGETYNCYITLMSDKRYAVFLSAWDCKDTGLTVYADEECLRHAWEVDKLYTPTLVQVKIDPVTGAELPS